MNIFYTDPNPAACARHHCKRHTVKMILETAQLLSTAHRVLDGDEYADSIGLYKKTHANHPCAVWVRESTGNYKWAYALLVHLCSIYLMHSEKSHKTVEILCALYFYPDNMNSDGFTTPPQCMPEKYRQEDTCQAYRDYLNAKFHEWTCRDKPLAVEWYGDVPDWVSF